MLRRLGEGSGTLLSLMQGMSSLAPFFTLQQLEGNWLALELASGEKSLVTLEPQSTVLERCHPPAGAVCIRWSRLIQITPETDGVLLEATPRDPTVAAARRPVAFEELAGPSDWTGQVRGLPQEFQELRNDLLMLLLTAGVAGVVEADGTPSCDHQRISSVGQGRI